jgi:hypothetical protein
MHRCAQVLVIEKGSYKRAAELPLLERDAFKTMYEGCGLAATDDAGALLVRTAAEQQLSFDLGMHCVRTGHSRDPKCLVLFGVLRASRPEPSN